jgi:hypothetical protein
MSAKKKWAMSAEIRPVVRPVVAFSCIFAGSSDVEGSGRG